jgi:hypothetical protein
MGFVHGSTATAEVSSVICWFLEGTDLLSLLEAQCIQLIRFTVAFFHVKEIGSASQLFFAFVQMFESF